MEFLIDERENKIFFSSDYVHNNNNINGGDFSKFQRLAIGFYYSRGYVAIKNH